MVVRCFARRALLPVRRHGCRRLSTSLLARQDEVDTSKSAITIPQEHSLQNNFFSSTTAVSQAFARRANELVSEQSSSSNSHIILNPLVRELLSELYDEGKSPSPDRIWNLYYAIHKQAKYDGSSSSQSLNILNARDHQAILRAISRKPKRQGRRETREESYVSYRYKGALLSGSRKAPDHVSSYLQRVLFIFSHLKQSEKELLPNVVDYDTVLERLAPGGNMPALSALWAHLTGSNREDFSTQKASGHPYDAEASHQPSPRTYLHLMMGISRHLSSQIERIHKQSISNDIWKGQGRKRERKEQASALAASRGQAHFGQEVSPQARRAVRLASARTVSLLEDMIHRRIKPEKITIDLAMRMLRMDGNVGGIKVLMKAFGIDLENPDADSRIQSAGDESLRLEIDIHTLNTIIMALGEQSTVSEMITAYETLTRPITKGELDGEGVKEMQGSLFTTDWRGIFQKSSESVQGVEETEKSLTEKSDLQEIEQQIHPLAILPNTTTLTVMIRHCCNAPDPARMVAGEQAMGSRKALIKQEDHEARQEGDYLSVACYILSEAIEVQEQETARMAIQLGIGMPSVQSLNEKVDLMLQPQQQDEVATPLEIDKEGFFEKVLQESKKLASSVLALPEEFVPHYLPPALGVNYDMIQPIVKHISRRRTADFARWRWLLSQTQRVIAIKIAELQILHQATTKWEEIRLTNEFGPNLSNEGLKSILTALRKQRRMVRTEILDLGTNLMERMMERFAALRSLRRRRKIERVSRKEQERERLLQNKVEEDQKKQRTNLQRQQQIHNEQQALQQEAIIPIVEVVYK